MGLNHFEMLPTFSMQPPHNICRKHSQVRFFQENKLETWDFGDNTTILQLC